MDTNLSRVLEKFDCMVQNELMILSVEDLKVALQHIQQKIRAIREDIEASATRLIFDETNELDGSPDENGYSIEELAEESTSRSEADSAVTSSDEALEGEKTNVYFFLDENNQSIDQPKQN